MKITIVSMFPGLFDSLIKNPVVARAVRKGEAELEIVDLKLYADGCFRHIDDSPYGGSPGMILRMEPLVRSLRAVIKDSGIQTRTVLLSPKGIVYNQSKAREYSRLEHLVLFCGHYEGTDSRFDSYVDELLSIGDYILTGGEAAACVVAESVIRLLGDTLKEGVTEDESYENGLLEYQQFTHPRVFEGLEVPDVLLSGNVKAINEWKKKSSLGETEKYRPDLLKKPGFVTNVN